MSRAGARGGLGHSSVGSRSTPSPIAPCGCAPRSLRAAAAASGAPDTRDSIPFLLSTASQRATAARLETARSDIGLDFPGSGDPCSGTTSWQLMPEAGAHCEEHTAASAIEMLERAAFASSEQLRQQAAEVEATQRREPQRLAHRLPLLAAGGGGVGAHPLRRQQQHRRLVVASEAGRAQQAQHGGGRQRHHLAAQQGRVEHHDGVQGGLRGGRGGGGGGGPLLLLLLRRQVLLQLELLLPLLLQALQEERLAACHAHAQQLRRQQLRLRVRVRVLAAKQLQAAAAGPTACAAAAGSSGKVHASEGPASARAARGLPIAAPRRQRQRLHRARLVIVRALQNLDPTSAGGPLGGPYRWWEEAELQDLCAAVGLADFRRERDWRFIMFAATKPGGAGSAASAAPWDASGSASE
ncbi:hypothetical protein TSOC_011016 [Tetrabaena socialis]|uniref:Uncharacterized protein n=1 Tax=Tetrabaena socialis TaxID=47790 RepID=A0A2J7ZRR2_9CHLO|nr:hypothetical protein TSOC_011016 [Tetrabaena socialis]|eukprot:PNH02967.1 hypothetical protein TSOC_011016 [Tetrabaena socialis]